MGKVILDKKLILLFLLFLANLTCSSKSEKPIPEKQLEGWAGNPNNPNEKPFDYFYMNHAARASQKAITIKNGKMMEATCKENAALSGKGNLIRKMIGTLILDGMSPSGQLHNISPIINSHTINDTVTKKNLIVINLIAMTYEENIGKIILNEYVGKIKGAEAKDCKPLAIPDQEVPLSEWKECECLIYSHIPGGRDGIIIRAKELDKD